MDTQQAGEGPESWQEAGEAAGFDDDQPNQTLIDHLKQV